MDTSGAVAGLCEHGNEPCVPIKAGGFLYS
jgi:hypothetical protein